jgi:hypothetical protein
MLEIAVLMALSLVGAQQSPSPRVEVTNDGMTVVHQPQTHVLVARVEEDGSLSTACAAREEEVKALLVAKASKKGK